MKKTLLTICFFIAALMARAQNPNFDWVKQIGDSSADNARAIARDASGNLFVAGIFARTVDFDPGPGVFNLTSALANEIFVLKLNAAGNFVWAVKTNGWKSNLEEMGMTCDAAGNVFVTGHFADSVDFDPGTTTFNLISNGGRDIFIWHLDASGNFVWAKNIGGTQSSILSDDVGYDIKTDSWGNIYTIGSFEKTADFDPGPGTDSLYAGPYCDIFILKLNANGDYVYAKNFGGTNYCIGRSIAIDALGNIYATGSFSDTVDFNPGAAVFNLIAPRSNQFVPGDPDIFVLKLDSSGNFIWAQNFGATREDIGQAIHVDATGNVYTTGVFEQTVDFNWSSGTFNLSVPLYEDMFVLKSDSAGNFIWANQIKSSSFYDGGNAITADTASNVYLTGSFAGTADLDPGIDSFLVSTPSSSSDMFILKLNANGNFVWGGSAGGIQSDVGEGMLVDNNGSVFTAGSFNRTADFDLNSGMYNLTSVGSLQDIFILKMNQNPVSITENTFQNNFFVYPNPASDKISISGFKLNSAAQFKIFDVLGKEVLKADALVRERKTEIDVRKFKSGIYFLQIITGSSTDRKVNQHKFVIR